MPHREADDVQEVSNGVTVGTGSPTLGGASGNYRTFVAGGWANGDTFWGKLQHSSLNEAEVCLCTWTTGGVITRSTPLWSTNGGAAVNFSAGVIKVTCVQPAGRERFIDDVAAGAQLVPPSGLALFSRNMAGRRALYVSDPSGDPYPLQGSIWRNKRFEWSAQGNGTVVATWNFLNTITGTATSRTVAATNFFTMARRIGYVSAATAGSSAGTRHGSNMWMLGNAAGVGGFLYSVRFGVSDAAAVADARMFVGISSTSAVFGNVNPSTLLTMIGVGCDNAQTTLRIMSNDGTGVATTTDLGANFPSNTLSTDLYELTLYCKPNATSVGWRVERLNTGHVAEGTITTDLPANTTLLSPQVWRNNGATALAVGIDVVNQYIETDY